MDSVAAAEDRLDSLAGTLSDRVYRHLAGRLVAGRLTPGERLSMRAVAAGLGLSMMPVREAFLRLGAEGALDVEPKKAVTVPLMAAAQFRDLTRVRVGVEGMAAAMAAESATRADIAEIARAEKAFRLLASNAAPDLGDAVGANHAFHFALYRAAGSPELLAIIERLWLRAGPIINFDIRGPERLRIGGAARCHAAILAALKEGDADAARRALAADISSAADFILSSGRLPD